MRETRELREQDKFLPSPTRSGKSAVEVYVGNPGDISGGGVAISADIKVEYQEALAVVSGITSTILTHSFSPTNTSKVQNISISGGNTATYELFINSQLIEKKRTYFGDSLDTKFDFNQGFKVPLGSTLEVKVHHLRPYVGDFNATLKYTEAL